MTDGRGWKAIMRQLAGYRYAYAATDPIRKKKK